MSGVLPPSFAETGVVPVNFFSAFDVLLQYHYPNVRGPYANGLTEEKAAMIDMPKNLKTLHWFSPHCSMENKDCAILTRLDSAIAEMDEELAEDLEFYRQYYGGGGHSRIAQFYAAFQLTDKPNSAPLHLQYTARKAGNRNQDLHTFLHFLSLAKGTMIDTIQVDSELPEQLWPIAYGAGEELRCRRIGLLGEHSSSSTKPLIQALLLPNVKANQVSFMTKERLDDSYEDFHDLLLAGKGSCSERVELEFDSVEEDFFPGLVKVG